GRAPRWSEAMTKLMRIARPLVLASLLGAGLAHADEGESDGTCKVEPTGGVPVAIQAAPPGAIPRVRRGGKVVARGRTPFARLLPPAKYELEVDAARGEPERRSFEARAGEAVALVVRFPR